MRATFGTPEQPLLDAVAEAIVRAASDAKIGVVVCSVGTLEPRILYASEEYARLAGTTPEELVGKDALTLVPPEEYERTRTMVEQLARGESPPPHFEMVIQRRDGSRVPVEVALCYLGEGQPQLAVGFLIDITSRKDALRVYQQSEERFRSVIEAAPEAVWILDGSALLYVNPAAIALFGYDDSDQVLGADPRRFLHPDDLPVIEQRRRIMLEERRRLPPHEYRAQRRDGSFLVLEVSSIPIEYEGRSAVLSFARDVSERKRIELRLLQADRLAALGLLAGGMAHAINNPLTYVLLDLDHVARRLPSLANDPAGVEDVVARLKEAYQGAERIAGVVRRMRAFSRVDERVRRAVDVRRVLDAAVEMVGHEIRYRGRLVTAYEEVPPIDVSEAHLEQVFLHLLVHAAQSLPEEERNEVRLEVRRSDDARVMVSLTVTGRAMDSATLARVFDPFYAREDERSALGLPFCRAVITSLGGEIVAESDARTGTTFRVLLPTGTPAHTAPASANMDSSRLPELRARVMVVDDDPGIGSALRIALEDVHSVTCFTSAFDARDRLLSGEQFDVVFCDVMMPDLDGTKLYQAVLQSRPEQAARFVFMSAGAARRDISEFLARCGRPRLDKPFDTKTVRRVVRVVAG